MPKTQQITALFILLAVLFCSSAVFAEDKPVFLVTLIRHGDRTPCYHIPSSPYDWKLRLGELTPLGMHQEYLLGKSYRARYVEKLGFLPPTYKDNTIYARSTDYNRTIMSAQAFLCGLYPPGTGPLLDNGCPAIPYGYQLIPIRTVPAAQDLLLLGNIINKKKINELRSEYVFTTDEWKKMNSAYQDRFARWSKIFGVKINSLKDLDHPADNVNVRLLKGAELPEGLTESEAREIAVLFSKIMAQECRPRKIGCIVARDFMRELISNIEEVVEGKQDYRFILYSAHDTTMLPVLSMLGTPSDSQVPYASNLAFELYRNENGYSVKVRLNDKDIILPFSGNKTICTFEQFKKSVLDESW